MPVDAADNTRRLRPTHASQQASFVRVENEMDALCNVLGAGSRIPSHVDLMAQMQASERTILAVLETFRLQGRIVRRPGAGTFVADAQLGQKSAESQAKRDASVIVVCKPDNSFTNRCVDMLNQQADQLGFSVICHFLASENLRDVKRLCDLPGSLGYILLGAEMLPVAQMLHQSKHQVVALAAPPLDMETGFPCIHADNEQGAYLATRHLIELGHRHISFAMVDTHPQRSVRWIGHRIAIREAERAGLAVVSTVLLRSTVATWRGDPDAPARYFHALGAPTGLVVWNDREAITLLTVLLRAGVKTPEEVSLVGYDNLPEGAQVSPSLTTIDQDVALQVRHALDILRQPQGASSPLSILVPPTLIKRASSAKL
jgi:DNA-binding LacI/PurR family transcriptional regulator